MVKWNLVPIQLENGSEVGGIIIQNKEIPSDYMLIYVIENDIARYIISRSVYHRSMPVSKEDQWRDPEKKTIWYEKNTFFEEKEISFKGKVEFKQITDFIRSKNKPDKYRTGDNYSRITKYLDMDDPILDKDIIKNSLAVAHGEAVMGFMVILFVILGLTYYLLWCSA